MKIGDPLDRSTDHGPQNHRAHLEKLLEYCQEGVKEGAKLVYGGKQVDRKGTGKAVKSRGKWREIGQGRSQAGVWKETGQ